MGRGPDRQFLWFRTKAGNRAKSSAKNPKYEPGYDMTRRYRNPALRGNIPVIAEIKLSDIPRDAEWYETQGSWALVHAAAPNTLRIEGLTTLSSIPAIGDEDVTVFDKLVYSMLFDSASVTTPQRIHFFTVLQPSAGSFTAGNYDPTAGFWTALDSVVQGGAESKFLKTVETSPDKSGSQKGRVAVQVDLTKQMNDYVIKAESCKNLEQVIPEFYLVVAVNGVASATDTIYYNRLMAYHTRRRRVLSY